MASSEAPYDRIDDLDDSFTPALAEAIKPVVIAEEHGGVGAVSSEERSAVYPPFTFRRLWQFTGPGWLMSIAYLDPGNLESDLQAGAFTGYQLLWVLCSSTLLGLFMQWLSLRLGVATGKHLAQLCRQEYPAFVRYVLFAMIELAIIGSDIQEVIGSAIAMQILFGLPLWAGVLITAADTFTFLFLHAFGVRKLEAFFAALITCMCVCFFVDFGIAPPSIGGMAMGFVPYMHQYALFQAMGLVGSIIMPHNMYLHSALVQSRPIDRTRPSLVREAMFYFTIEASVALFVSFLINVSVVAVFAHAFFDELCAPDGKALVNGDCTEAVGLSNAGDALRDALGGAAQIVWAIGLLASGQSSTMTGVTTGQFVMTGFLQLRWKPWQQLMVTRSIAIVPALIVGVSATEDQTVLDFLNECINVFMSYQLPFAVLPMLHLTGSTRVMGDFVNRRWMKVLGWISGLLLIPLNIAIVSHLLGRGQASVALTVAFALVCALYFLFLLVLVRDDIREFVQWARGEGGVEAANVSAHSISRFQDKRLIPSDRHVELEGTH